MNQKDTSTQDMERRIQYQILQRKQMKQEVEQVRANNHIDFKTFNELKINNDKLH